MIKTKLTPDQKAARRTQRKAERRAQKDAARMAARAEKREIKRWDAFVARMRSLGAWIEENESIN